MSCPKCKTKMVDGKAIAQTYTGVGDFGDDDIVTLSPGGPGKLVSVSKCPQCGFSTTRVSQ